MITCILLDNEISMLYTAVTAFVEDRVKNDKPLDAEDIMKQIYNKIAKSHSPEKAAEFVQHVPRIIIDLLNTAYQGKVNISPQAFGELWGASTAFYAEDGINTIIQRFKPKRKSKADSTAEKKTRKRSNPNKKTKDNLEEKEEPVEEPTEKRYKSFSALKGTIQEYLKRNPTTKRILVPEKVDSNRVVMQTTLKRLANTFDIDDDGLAAIKYQNEFLKLKAIRLDKFAKEFPNQIDATTMQEITRSEGMVNKGVASADVAQTADRVVIVVTDKGGNVLFFNEDGDIVSEKEGKPVYQFMYDVRKSGDRLVVTDIYGKEEKIATPELIAEKTYNKETDGPLKEYIEKIRKAQQEEFQRLYDLKKSVVSGKDQELIFDGVSEGLSSDINNVYIPLNQLRSLGVDRKVFKTIETLKTPEGGLSKGMAVIEFNGTKFELDRSDISSDIVNQIAEVLTNKNIPFRKRLDFAQQFLSNDINPTARRHTLIYDVDKKILNLSAYQYTTQESWEFVKETTDPVSEKTIKEFEAKRTPLNNQRYKFYYIAPGTVINGKEYKQGTYRLFEFNDSKGRGQNTTLYLSDDALAKATPEVLANVKAGIIDALERGYYQPKFERFMPTKLNYAEHLLDSGQYEVYDTATGKFQKKDYIDFLMNLESTVSVKTKDPGFYNAYMSFTIPSDANLERQETEEEIPSVFVPLNPFESGVEETDLNKLAHSIYKQLETYGQTSEWIDYLEDQGIVSNSANTGFYVANLLRQQFEKNAQNAYTKELANAITDVFIASRIGTEKQRAFINKGIEGLPSQPFTPPASSMASIIEQATVPEAPNPTNTNTNAAKETEADSDYDFDELERGEGLSAKTTRAQRRKANKWWNTSETGKKFQEVIELSHLANLVNSNAFAEFTVAGATLIDNSKLGQIKINPLKGSMVDVYHEAFHVFTQLFLTKAEKIVLYKKVKEYTDDKGNQPYKNMTYFQIEEMLAEDFRTYAKDKTLKDNIPVKNTIFRRMLKFLQAMFSKIKGLLPISKQDVVVDSSSIPAINELFENLYYNKNNFLNNYQPLIKNIRFNVLNRGITKVNNSREDALSTTDSDLMVATMDSIISEEIDRLHDDRKDQGVTKSLKAGVINLLTSDKNRTVLYKNIRKRLTEDLEREKAKLFLQPNVKKFSEFTSLDDIKENAVGVMKNAKGEDKYIFLRSQIDDFSELSADIKKGARVKGEKYFDIPIVADFYVHRTLKSGKKTVDIMVVSQLSDAQVQYENYVKGGAKAFTEPVMKEGVEDSVLTQEQELVLDNVRILQATLDNFGDPEYWKDGRIPAGVIKYHLEKSRFTLLRKSYVDMEYDPDNDYESDDYEDEENEDGIPTNEEAELEAKNKELTNDSKVGKYSLQQLADNSTLYILSSLFYVDANGNNELDRFGHKKLSNFKDTWNIVAKSIAGMQDAELMYSTLNRLKNTYPILRQLVEKKLPNPKYDPERGMAITNSFEVDNIVGFWQTFRRPKVPYIQLMYFPIVDTQVDPFTGNVEFVTTGYDSEMRYASVDGNTIIKRFQNEFASSPETEFISKVNNTSILNLDTVISKFSTKDGNLNTDKAIEFARAIGIYLDNTDALEKTINDNMNEYGIPYLFNIAKDIKNLQDKLKEPNNNLSTEAINLVNDFKKDPIGILKGKIRSTLVPSVKAKKGVVEQKNIIVKLAELNAKLGYETMNFGIKNANGDTVYENIDINSLYMQVNGLNTMESLDEAWTKPEYSYMSYLDPTRNAYTQRSILLNSMFNIETFMYDRRGERTIELAMDDGTRIPGKNLGNTTGTLTPMGKFNQELTLMLKSGANNMFQNADKQTTPIIRLLGGIIGEKSERGLDDHLYVDTNMFAPQAGPGATAGELYAVNRVLIQNLATEFDRIVMVKENRDEVAKIKGPNQTVDYDKDGKPLMAAEVFVAFDDVLGKDTKEALYELAEDWDGDIVEYLHSPENANLWNRIQNDIIKYFRAEVALNMSLFEDFSYDKVLVEKTGVPEVPADTIDKNAAEYERKGAIRKTLMTSFTYNSWIHNFEIIHLFFGDISQFNHLKEELQKRNAGNTSGGLGFMNSPFFNNFINNVFNAAQKNAKTGDIVGPTTYAQALNVRDNAQDTDKDYDNFVYNGRLNTGVIADAERESVYIKEMSESWREMYEEDYKEAIPDEAERKAFIDKLIEYDVDPYMKMTESDGAGYITIDAYRTLKKASKQWTYEQEQLYKKLVAGEKLTPKEVKEFFPPYKLQYYGPLHETVISVVGMHKFALTPLVPGALGGAQLQKLHEEMLRSNRQYVLFGSGSKVSTVTLDGNFDDVFLNDKQKAIKTGDDFQTANNIIYVEYLKDVTSVNSTFKKKVTAGTQQRVMFVDNFFKDGEIVNPEENKELVEGYIQNSRNITNVLIAELLNEIGFVYKDGMYQASGNSVEKFVNTIKKGLGKKAVPKHLVDLVGVNVGGQATMDYSLHPIADDIEALATALIQKRIIRQKAKGEPLIQVPSTLYNGLWDTDFELITDEKEIEKLLGSNNLPFYRRGKKDPKTGKYGPSSMMKVAITMQADFENLYQRLDLNGKKIAESPDPLGLLNKLIQNDEWLDKDDNRFAISVTGPRIPTDGINLVEGAEVWHFFEPQMGNIVVVPTEIVAKTGGDFDVDKLNFEYAYIDGDGFSLSKPLSNAEFKAKLTEATEKIAQRAEDRKKGKKKEKDAVEEVIVTPSAIINAQKKALHNQSIQLRLDILRLPDTFGHLTKPNSTYLVEQYAKLVAAAQPYKKLDNRTIKGYKFDPKDKDKAVMSPTRTLEIGYNMHKFEVNLSSGQLTLGITAKQNKQHVIDNEIGAKMPDSYFETVWKDGKYVPTTRRYLVDLHFNHNTTTNKKGRQVISLAGLQTRKGTRITSINSHNLNGILDRAKKSFPGELNMVPETMPIINHLIEAGVDEEQALYFVNLPLIKKYVRLQREFADVYGKIRMVAPDNSSMNKFQAAEKTVGEYEASGAQENTFVNEIRLKATFERLMAVLDELNPTTGLSVYFGQKVGYVQMTASQLKKGLQAGEVSPMVVRGISLYDERLAFPLQEQLYKPSSSIVSTANYYYAKRIAFDKAFGSQEGVFTTDLIKDSITENDTISRLALAFLLHYIQIEHQIKGMQEAAALMSPDTSFVKTIQQVRNRQQRIADLKKFGKVDDDLMNDFEKKSILGSFRIDQLMMDTIEPLFPLRLDRDISEYIEDATNRFSNTIAARFGQGIEGKERFSSMFNNAVVTSLFQNTLSNFPNAKIIDEDLMLPEGYKGYKISINNKQAEAVKIENGVISINIELTKSDFADGMYLDNVNKPESYLGRGLFAFDAERDPFVRVIPKDKGGLLAGTSFRYFSNYVLFTVQRELLRTNNPIEKVREEYMFQDLMSQFNLDEQAAYEMYLVKRALRNSFNPGYVMGLSQFNYTDDVMRLLNQFPVLKQKFGIASQLAPESRTKTDKNIIVLNDSKATGDVADGYHNDLVQLGDITIRKGSDAENKYISDTFKFFSEMMYYQHGIGYSSFGFVKVYDSAGYITLMRTVGINYLQNPIDENQLEGITINLLDNSDIFKNYVVTSGFKRMVTDTAFEEYDEEDMLNELEQMNRKAKNPLVAEVIEAINAVETTNPFRAKDIEMFKDADAFIGFETTLNDPRLDAKSSTKVYRQAFGNLANKGKYTPDEVVALSGSGNFNRGGLDLTTAIQEDFRNKYKPEILRAIDSGVSTFLLGSYNDQRNLQDYYIQKYLESKGYTASTVVVGKYEYYKFTKEGSTFETSGIKPEFKNSLFRGQEAQPVIDENGNLILVSTYDSLFKSEGISFAETLDMAEGYGARYSKNPYIVEIDANYADKVFPLDVNGGTKSYGKRVIGDEGEQRFVSKDNILIPEGSYKIHRKNRVFNFEDSSAQSLVDAYNKQFIESDLSEYNRYGEAGKGYATEGSDYYDAVEKELMRRGLTKDELLYLQKPNPINSLEDIVGAIFNVKTKPGELGPEVTTAQIKQYQDKQKALIDKLTKESDNTNTPQQGPGNLQGSKIIPFNTGTPKGQEVIPGVYVNENALTKEEQLELFDYLKPYLEEQAAKTNKGANASKMIGLGLRWDYKNNNAGREAVNISDVIEPRNKTKYGYYNVSINGQSLGPISERFKELMEKASGVDMTDYDGAIINLYEKDTFISAHNDVDESMSAINYPVIGLNIGGQGNFSIEPRGGTPNQILDLSSGAGYVFGVNGVNRDVYHRTFPTPQNSFLPQLTTKIDGKTYPAGSYRVTVTMRRVMPLEPGMPTEPAMGTTPINSTADVILPIDFQENQTGGYPARTRINASADATIHLADNFETPGEKLTKKSVKEQGKVYRQIETNGLSLNAISKDSISAAINNIVKILNTVNAKSLNIAGNGIYDMKGRTQEEVDEFTYTILSGIINSPDLKNKITLIRSGGQTGFDEAGAKAGVRLGIPTIVLAPKDWEFRTNQGNFKDEAAFKARFDGVEGPSTETSTEQDFNFTNTQKIASLEQEIYELESQREEILSSTVEGITVSNMPKIKPESASKETGGRVGTNMDINIGLTSKDGVSVEKAAELIWMDNFADTESGITDYDIRNIIIDILSVGKKRYIEQITKQDEIEDIKNQIAVLKGEATAERLASMGTQLTLFDENAPEGLPPSKRSSKKCNN